MDFLELMQNRYTTKYYDHSKRIPEEIFDKILKCLRLSPSSVNMQGWKFITLESDAAKARIRAAIPDFNVQRFDSCDKVIVLCAKNKITPEWTVNNARKQCADGRFPEDKIQPTADGCFAFANQHDGNEGTLNWTARQTYIAMATILYAAASYGVDSTAVEGVDTKKVDEFLQLDQDDLNCTALVLLGYRSATDSNTMDKRPKSRLDESVIIERNR